MLPLLLTLAFILELVAFVSFSALSFVFDSSSPMKILFASVSFILLIIFWGLYMSPRATKKLGPTNYYIAKLIIYSVSAFVIFSLIGGLASFVFVIAFLADELLLYRLNIA